ncbi:sodium:solute symporter [Pedobacter changchengzhani]|uniref:Sodium:solute symporter n=1 Tax=Pedobacter changchengzhani TaxID=2529274 RepID=A0A4R5MLM2_9SPHI|nr:sodium:solute symporter [Pedobacter changchengzhani]
MENENEEKLNSVLSEAYYSINCDYYLSYYLQYPSFVDKPEQDFLKSYFEIWKNGHYCKFDKSRLIIYK